ncbi:hypothetical protein SASPL_145645 [Salvia splendens]|uniref:Thaumatin-like protein n=1 Tax=Salvia splendens TaxID=180675 RepID=A0A8X8Z8K2_SALSN|nr:hypothetical protein SASPL_145645 [Salvia splendens]
MYNCVHHNGIMASFSWLTSPILHRLFSLSTAINKYSTNKYSEFQDPKLPSSRCKTGVKKPYGPGALSGAGHALLINGGLQLKPNEKTSVVAPFGWSGRFWARSGCKFDQSGKQGNCATGNCGGLLQCSGAGGPPASLAEFTLDSPEDFYDVSLVDGFNIPISIIPSGGSGNCSAVECSSNLNLQCPEQLQVRVNGGGDTVACKSACLAFGQASVLLHRGLQQSTGLQAQSLFRGFQESVPHSL